MKTILLPITGDMQIEALRAAIADRLEAIQENIDACDADDESDAENIAAYEQELLALESIEGNFDDARPAQILVIVEGGLVQDVYASVGMDVQVWDMDVEDDDRNHDLPEVLMYVREHELKEVY